MNANELIEKLKAENPQRTFAVSTSGDTVGVLFHGVWVAIYSKMLDGRWADSPHVLVNGEPVKREWIPQ
jgi:hypothetical protein